MPTPAQMPAPAPKPSWEELVKGSRGTLMFLPDKFVADAKAWVDKRNELNGFLDKASKVEIETAMLLNKVIFEFRQYLEENGQPENWRKDFSFELNALKEGKFVVCLQDAIPGK